MNGKGVRSFWLNALIITTVIFMWLWLVGAVIIGGTIAYQLSDSDTPSAPYDYGDSYEEYGE
jgi:hypothetical protein